MALLDDGQLAIYHQSSPPEDVESHIWTSGTNWKMPSDLILESIENAHYAFDLKSASLDPAEPEEGITQHTENDTDLPQTPSVTLSVSVTESDTYDNTIGGKVGVEVSGEAGVPFVAKGKVSVSAEVSFDHSWGHTKSKTTSHSATVPVATPAHSSYWAKLIMSKVNLNCDFEVTGIFVYTSGPKYPQKSNSQFTGVRGTDYHVHYGMGEETLGVIPLSDLELIET